MRHSLPGRSTAPGGLVATTSTIVIAALACFGAGAAADDVQKPDAPLNSIVLLPDSLASLTEYGVTLALSGDLDGGERCFVTLLARSPGDPRALNNLGNIHLLRGEADLALAFYERAAERDTADCGIRLNTSIALMQGGEGEAALREAVLAVDEAGGIEGAAYLLGLRSEGLDESVFKGSDSQAEPALTQEQIVALLKEASVAVPDDEESGGPQDSTAITEDKGAGGRTESGARDTKKGTWRSAALRASDLPEASLNLYWKLQQAR